MILSLKKIGWNEHFQQWFSQVPYKPGRVIRKHNFGYDVAFEEGIFASRLRGKLRKELSKAQWPAVGDWVGGTIEQGYAMIEVLAPRTGKISRKAAGKTSEEQVIAANADTIFLVVSLSEDFNVRKIERYIALAAEGGAKPIIILNKTDLTEEAETYKNEILAIAPSISVLCTNALKPETLAPLFEYTSEGHTVVFLGSSGVGKSTIVNVLLGKEKQAVGAIGKNNKGTHTTSSRDMFFLENGGILIDNPGVRELRVWLDGDASLQDSFSDIEALSSQCHFRDCLHQNEPGCAVKEAVEKGLLSSPRLENWRKLKDEALELLIRRQERGCLVEKSQISHAARAYKQIKQSGRYGLR